jgi:UDP-2-acetamido-3-amino-2,3-dideoxy-glucuronate N-acetyltransferase
MSFFVHTSSIVEKNVKIGAGSKIWHFCHISENAKIGKNVTIGQNVFIGKGVLIGDGCKIQNNVSVYEGIKLEKDVFIGPSVVFTNVKVPRAFIEQKKNFKRTLVKKGSSIGANSTIVCGNVLGKYSFVGAGSLVIKNVKDFNLVYGCPSEPKAIIDKSGKIIKKF